MKLLCATDLESKSDAAVDRAYLLRDALNMPLTLVHVVPSISTEDGTLEQRLLSASNRLAMRARHAGGNAELVVRCGRPARVVGEEARNARFIIAGPHGGDVISDAIHGTFGERVLSEARCPVLIARSPARAPYRKLLLALDGSSATRNVIHAAESLPVAPEAELAVVHAHEPPYEAMMSSVGVGNVSVARYASASLSQAAAMLHAELQRHSSFPRRYRVMLMDSRPGPAIRQAILEMQPDLLVLGTRGHGRFRRALLGSTAHAAMRQSECDVLLVPEAAKPRLAPVPADDDPGPQAA